MTLITCHRHAVRKEILEKYATFVQVIFPQNVKSQRQLFEYFFTNFVSLATFNESVQLVLQNMVQRHHKTPKYKKRIFLYQVNNYSYGNDVRRRFCTSVVTKGRNKAVPCFIYATL